MSTAEQLADRMLEICQHAPEPVHEQHVRDAAIESILARSLGRHADVGVATALSIYTYKHAIRIALTAIRQGDYLTAIENLDAMLRMD